MEKQPDNDTDKVITLLNQAQSSQDTTQKLAALKKVRELIIRKDPSLLDNFLEEVISFLGDPSSDVKQFVIGFLEESCLQDSKCIIQVVPHIPILLEDRDPHFLKRVIRCSMQLYKITIKYVAGLSKKQVDDRIQDIWDTITEIKSQIMELIEAENDGIRTFSMKFLEILILAHSKKTPESEIPKGNEMDLSLEKIPLGHPVLKTPSLKEEAGMAVNKLLFLVASPSISSTNLMVCIGSLSSIAKQRPAQLLTVIQSFELLFANLPPNFTKAQVSSVRKFLKLQCLGLYRHHCAINYKSQLSTLLTNLGATANELNKHAPRPPPETMKRSTRHGDPNRTQTGANEENESSELETPEIRKFIEAVELTAEDLLPRLQPFIVTEIVIASLKKIPDSMPSSFRDVYTPIESAGTEAQVRQLSKLLANLMTARGIGVGADKMDLINSPDEHYNRSKSDATKDKTTNKRKLTSITANTPSNEYNTANANTDFMEYANTKRIREDTQLHGFPTGPLSFSDILTNIINLNKSVMMYTSAPPNRAPTPPMGPPLPPSMIQGGLENMEMEIEKGVQEKNLIAIPQTEHSVTPRTKIRITPKPTGLPKPRHIKQFKLSDIAMPAMDDANKKKYMLSSVRRILEAEQGAIIGGHSQDRTKLIITLITQFGGTLRDALRQFIVEDIRARIELALAWLYQEYVLAEGYYGADNPRTDWEQYDSCLCGLLKALKPQNTMKDKVDARDRLFSRLLLEAPRITEGALIIVRQYCHDEERVNIGIATLKELILNRPSAPGVFLQTLLELTTHDRENVRKQSISVTKVLYNRSEFKSLIEKFALEYLEQLKEDHPPISIAEQDIDTAVGGEMWIEDTMRLYFSLYMALLPLNHELIHQLAHVYGQSSNPIKKCILRYLQHPVSAIGMHSSELYKLLDNCPTGAETLITRMLHILTEKNHPIPELVIKVKELYYNRRMSDVRFLIPVLNGLDKEEIIAALPHLIQLSVNVVKEVFHRLLVLGQERGKIDSSSSSTVNTMLRPAELMIALHSIELKDEKQMKAVVQAMNLCFKEADIFTHDVLAGVLQQLLDTTPLPTLFMRTVLQSLQSCPRIISFVIGILSKLITKQVWRQPKQIWQGFVKCCQHTKPQSFPIMLQLQPRQLENALEICPELREPLAEHVKQYTPIQRAKIQRSVLTIIEKIETANDFS